VRNRAEVPNNPIIRRIAIACQFGTFSLRRCTKNQAIPAIFAEPFLTRGFLFLGYSLRDWNLRVVLNRMEKDYRRSGELTSWAIQYKPSALERKFWEKRGVEVFDIPLDQFVVGLRGANGK
jgi:hypothetical protein